MDTREIGTTGRNPNAQTVSTMSLSAAHVQCSRLNTIVISYIQSQSQRKIFIIRTLCARGKTSFNGNRTRNGGSAVLVRRLRFRGKRADGSFPRGGGSSNGATGQTEEKG